MGRAPSCWRLQLFALFAIWKMDWENFKLDVAIGGENQEVVYLAGAGQFCNTEESSHWKWLSANWISPDPIIPHQFKVISVSVYMYLSQTITCLVSLIIQVHFLMSLTQPVSPFNLGAVFEWWGFICLESAQCLFLWYLKVKWSNHLKLILTPCRILPSTCFSWFSSYGLPPVSKSL